MIQTLQSDQIHLILPALRQVQDLHADARPDLFCPWQGDAAYVEAFQHMMAKDGLRLLGDLRDGLCLGFLSFEIVELASNVFRTAQRHAHLHHISVLDSHRRQGIGTALIAAMKDQMRAAGVTRWTVTYWTFNAASAALMASAGAQVVHHRSEGGVTQPPYAAVTDG